MVSLGGDVAVAGPAPDEGWRIGVGDDHRTAAAGPVVTIRAGGLATSGTTVRQWRRGTVAQHHIVDPRTGQAAEVVWRTVSVAAANCVDANTASTAAVVLGRAAPAWLAAHNLPARLVAASGAVLTIAGWPTARGRAA
jgi:thiamine biosynthesis lipoprotein